MIKTTKHEAAAPSRVCHLGAQMTSSSSATVEAVDDFLAAAVNKLAAPLSGLALLSL